MRHPVGVDLWEFYDRVENLILDLREGRQFAAADLVETAIRGGATSGEILGRLGLALAEARAMNPERSAEIQELEAFVEEALGPRW
jgi:hypothetical protein